jgi:membrane protein DedA with SNARE-associated domain
VRIVAKAGAGITAALPAATGLLVLMEAGVPVPIPSDLLMLLVGERAGAGKYSIAAAVIAFEIVAIVGTTALFLVARGPGQAMITRLGPKVGLTEQRMARARGIVERRGRLALAVGRTTPGLRTVTCVVAAGAGLSAIRVLPVLIVGSSIFLQVHLILGYTVGASARHALAHDQGAVAVALVGLAVAAAAVWSIRRRRRSAVQGWTEGSCPACLAIALLAPEDRATGREPDASLA